MDIRKKVSSNQGVQLVNLANSLGISRTEFDKLFLLLKDEKSRGRILLDGGYWLDNLRADARRINAKVYSFVASVDYTKTIEEAVICGCSDVDPSWWENPIGMDNYVLPSDSVVEEVFVLVNYPHGGGDPSMTAKWAISNKLKESNPYEIFATGKNFPDFRDLIGEDVMFIIETKGFLIGENRYSCSVHGNRATREPLLIWQGRSGNVTDYFLFRKEVFVSKDLKSSH